MPVLWQRGRSAAGPTPRTLGAETRGGTSQPPRANRRQRECRAATRRTSPWRSRDSDLNRVRVRSTARISGHGQTKGRGGRKRPASLFPTARPPMAFRASPRAPRRTGRRVSRREPPLTASPASGRADTPSSVNRRRLGRVRRAGRGPVPPYRVSGPRTPHASGRASGPRQAYVDAFDGAGLSRRRGRRRRPLRAPRPDAAPRPTRPRPPARTVRARRTAAAKGKGRQGAYVHRDRGCRRHHRAGGRRGRAGRQRPGRRRRPTDPDRARLGP